MAVRDFRGLNAVAQIRVSSPKQIANGSLDNQEKEIISHGKREGYNLRVLFREEGDSGAALFKRHDLLKALDYCSDPANNIKIFITYKIDRFTRDIYDFHWFIRKLDELGIQLVSVTEDYDNTIEGEFIRDFYALIADKDRKDVLRRLGIGQANKWREGYKCGVTPIGYLKDPGFSKSCRNTIKDPLRYELIKLGWSLLQTEQYTLSQILEVLREHNLQTLKGKPLQKSTLSQIFRNMFYAGYITVRNINSKYGDFNVEPVIGKHYDVRMLEIGEFYKCQTILDKKAVMKGEKMNQANPNFELVKLLKCVNCSSLMSGSFAKKTHRYYRCYSKKCTRHQNLKAETVEEAFHAYLQSLKPDPQFVDMFKKFLEVTYKASDEQQLELARTYENQITRTNAKIENIKMLTEDGFYEDTKEPKKKINGLIGERASLEEKLAQCLSPSEEMDKIIETNVNLLQHLSGLWERLTPLNRIRFNERIFPAGVCFIDNKICNLKLSPAIEYITDFSRKLEIWLPQQSKVATVEIGEKPSLEQAESLKEVHLLVTDKKWDGIPSDLRSIFG